MSNFRKHWWTFLLFAICSLTGTGEVSAQSKGSASKRSFATLLARKAEAAVARPIRAANATTSVPLIGQVARSATIKPIVAQATYGTPAATSYVPPSGYGSGRDAYVEALYPQILGRAATQSDVDYWARVLYSGAHADTVARTIWNSQEHKGLEQSGMAPGIPLRTAYDRAYAVGLANCKERLAAERRRDEKE
jgi:hypothetical protein